LVTTAVMKMAETIAITSREKKKKYFVRLFLVFSVIGKS